MNSTSKTESRNGSAVAINVIPFQFDEHSVRTIADDSGEAWFSAKDVCAILGYRNDSDAVKKHCREHGVAKRDLIDNMGRKQEATFINEGNLYRLIVKSRKPEAERFEQLVMDDILPTIRKTGSYTAKPKRQPKAFPSGLSVEQQESIKALVKARIEALPKAKQAKAAITCWSALKSKFGCTYKEIEPEQFGEAVSLVARVVLEGELLGPEEPRRIAALTTARKIRSRDDLSFTKRDDQGLLINWQMPPRANNWHEHYGLGEIWFSEIIELARHDPREGYNAMKFAGEDLVRYWNNGHVTGFFDRMAQWALTAILGGHPEPRLPFKVPSLGIPVREGMDYHLAAAVPQKRIPPAEQEAIDARAWHEASEVQRHWFEQRRYELMARQS